MPIEDRRIVFSNSEVYRAIYALCEKRQVKKPSPGEVQKIYQRPDNPDQIIMDLKNYDDEVGLQLEYSSDFLAAALMVFCRGSGIPLPKKAQKSVMIKENKVILRVQM